MADYKWINTDRKGVCAQCETQLQAGERVLWSLVDKSKVWCRRCGGTILLDDITPPKQNDVREREGQSSTERAAAAASVVVRWEIVTGNDGTLTVRRLP